MSDVVVPNVGESISSGILANWLKNEGDVVTEGDNLFELETDKATMEVPATVAGVLHIQIRPGTEVAVGSVVATIEESSNVKSTDTPLAETLSQESTRSPHLPSTPTPTPTVTPPSRVMPRTLDDLSPAVRRLVEELSLNPASIPSADPSNHLSKEDVQKYVRDCIASASSPQVEKSGPILHSQKQERKPMTNLRKRIGERLVESKQLSAHLTTFNEVNMQAVTDLRQIYKERFEKKHGVRLGFMSFFLKAAVHALKQFPEINAFVDGTDIIYNHFYDISVALSSERGLITPVLRNVDSKSFAEIEMDILDFSQRAKDKKILPDELMGGTFTISNGGVFGSMLSTPIPNPPQTAILGMHSIQKRPIVIDDEIIICPMMYLALTYDHRILDGREAISFLRLIKTGVEDPSSLLLNV